MARDLGIRRRLGPPMWTALSRAGLTEQRWQAWSVTQRRAVIAAAVGALLLVVFAPLFGFAASAYIAYAIFVGLYVPPWEKVPYIGRYVLPLAVLGLVTAFPYYTTDPVRAQKMFTIPILGAWPSTQTAAVMLIYVMMALGLNVVVGYAGLLDLGYVAFYAVGAYTAASFTSQQFAGAKADGSPVRTFHLGAIGIDPHLGGIHITPWLLLLVGGLLTAVIGMVIGLPTLRLRGDYLAIVTLGFGEILPQVARNGDNLFSTGFNLTNGPQGITPLDSIGFGNWIHKHIHIFGWHFLPANYFTAANSDALFFWTALILVLLTIFCSLRLRDSKLGRAWIAIREDETAAAAMGVPLMRTKTYAYAIGAFVAGVAGSYFAIYTSGANPDSFFFNFSVFVLVMVILGGMGNVWGVMLGAAFLAYLDQAGLANTGAWINDHLGLHIEVPKYEFGIYGVILLVVMLLRPEGLLPSARRKREFEKGVADEPLHDKALA